MGSLLLLSYFPMHSSPKPCHPFSYSTLTPCYMVHDQQHCQHLGAC